MPTRAEWVWDRSLDLLGGVIFALIAYLAEIKISIYVMWLALVIDLLVGIRKTRKVDGERFNGSKFRTWVDFALISTMLVILIYAVEKEMVGFKPLFYNGFMIIITGFTISSILRNAELLTKKYIFTALLDYVSDAIERITGIDFRKYDSSRKK